VLLTEKDDGTSVTARVGDMIEVSLSENPSTGYRWEVAEIGSSIVSAEETSFALSGSGIGAGGTRHMGFRARHAGVGRVELILRRSWEPADAAIARWRIAIEVRDGNTGGARRVAPGNLTNAPRPPSAKSATQTRRPPSASADPQAPVSSRQVRREGAHVLLKQDHNRRVFSPPCSPSLTCNRYQLAEPLNWSH
jgi:inhibitor of cysteine peptidase